jgi:myo-inositol 2-dehydrogenase / D-chiro-inositol 1-dehydrogenase
MSKVRVGIIGMGVQGPVHVHWSANLREAKLVAVCDLVESRAKEVAAQYQCDWYSDYHQLLERKDVDAVILVTPPSTHAQVAIDAMKAGKHVAVEKPLCMDLEEASAMQDTAKKTGMLDGYFENLCYAPAYHTAKQILSDGGIGEAFFMRCGESDGKGLASYESESDTVWKSLAKEEHHYGVTHGGGCHPIMFCRYVYDRAPVKKVYAEMKGSPENAAFLTITYATGQIAWVDTSIYALGTFDDRAEIYGTKGTILADLYGVEMDKGVKVFSQEGFDPRIGSSRYPSGPGYFGRQTSWSHPIPDEEYSLGYFHEQQAFLSSIIKGTRPEVNFDDGRATLEVILAAYKSRDSGSAVSLPL